MRFLTRARLLLLLSIGITLLAVGGLARAAGQPPGTEIPVAAPIDSDSSGKGGTLATQSVVRILCPKEDSAGTGFLHKSGRIITAEHVVRDCSEIFVLPVTGAQRKASLLAKDGYLDLALLALDPALAASALPIAKRTNFEIGTQVSTWGFPGGYRGRVPLLSVGYLAGLEATRAPSGQIIRQWVVNAAFNRGNSGGPLLHIETGQVMGLVSSKLAPISLTAKNALDALLNQKSGFTYEATRPDGSKVTFSEGQVIGLILDELRKQVQLVIGKAVVVEDVSKFLRDHGVDP